MFSKEGEASDVSNVVTATFYSSRMLVAPRHCGGTFPAAVVQSCTLGQMRKAELHSVGRQSRRRPAVTQTSYFKYCVVRLMRVGSFILLVPVRQLL